ncbi:ATP-binding cassette domain-containing protein [Nocardia sp. CDC159]|uniref:ATP-binding cassette domain-containing protein n=1 Tax=Nocardia pulmonis TaxID=2951408 RepID=A0A9X2ECF8_9NOCA|nr:MULTISPECIES: ATP-binding cassette domain-containing protein [Nocardia]MCM6778202.1 ATP-binding cassette domain-containing protein [Nocardia pulmonis]MCM6791091.1 ATP-binding cassette domain-containing protein [Nocardia sp. CDC159]
MAQLSLDFPGVEVVARGITARGPQGCAFDGVSLAVEAGRLGVVTGPSGSGRTSLLLALAGRMRLVAGVLAVGGHRIPEQAARVRELVAVARAEPAVYPDAELSVREHIRERLLLGGPRISPATISAAFELLEIQPPQDIPLGRLHPDEQTVIAVALAAAERPGALVLDDVATAPVWSALHTLTGHGLTVLAATDRVPPGLDPEATTVIELAHPIDRDRLTTAAKE